MPAKQGTTKHGAALKGGRPTMAVLEEAETLIAETIDAHPWLARPEFRATVRRWAIAEVRCDRLTEYLDTAGMLDAHGRPRPATKLLLSAETTASRARAALGFDPASFAAIRKTVVEADSAQAALDAGLAEGRKAIARRGAELQAARQPEAPAIEEGGSDE